MANNGLWKSKSWVQGKVRVQGVSDEQRSLLIKSGGSLLLSAAIGYTEGFGSNLGFILTSAASDDDCCNMAQNGFEKTKSLAEMANNLAADISDEHRDFVVRGGGALLRAAAMGYYGRLGRLGCFRGLHGKLPRQN